jgi:Galactose oxidase, central domain
MFLDQINRFSRAFVIAATCSISVLIGCNSATASSGPTWTELSRLTSSPPARSYLAMTYDPVSGKIIMFGGYDGSGYLNDTWTFDGTTWTHLRTRGAPRPRAAAQMAYDAVTHQVVLFGGFNGRNYLGDTWIFDGNTSSWRRARTTQSPTPVTSPMLFTDPNGHADVYGGYDGQFYQYQMWQWTGTDWNQLNLPALPFARSSAAVALNPVTGKAVLFGGLADINPVNTWVYNGTTWSEKFPTTQPYWVYAASAAFDAGLNAVVLFGGGSGGVDLDLTWKWSGGNWTQVLTTVSPPAREGAGMAYDPLLGHIILFGGQNDVLLNDTWELVP